MYNRLFLSFLLLSSYFVVQSQSVIVIDNPSFEDNPRMGTDQNRSIEGWFDCGSLTFKNESPPDIHPGNFWEVNLPPSHGNTYLGMVVRDNESWEGLSQRLTQPIVAGKCYSFNIDLAQSKNYKSHSRVNFKVDQYGRFLKDLNGYKIPNEANFVTPTVLRVWGGSGYCNDNELLAESTPINHSDWRTYDFKIKSKFSHNFIMIEVFYKTPVLIPYCGHLLLDNLSNIVEESCDANKEELVEVTTPKSKGKPIPPHKAGRIPVTPPQQNVIVPTPPKKKKLLTELDVKKLKQGSTVEIKNLYFKADANTINSDSYEVLDEVYDFLSENPKIVIELGGHTNGQPSHEYCDKLSSERAKSVYEYLIKKGIKDSKITYKGYGKRRRIASDRTAEGRNKNQRVEIKIMSLG